MVDNGLGERGPGSGAEGRLELAEILEELVGLVERAKSLIMKVKCCFVEAPDEPVRSFPVVVSDGKKGPIAMQEVIGSRELMAAVLEQAKADLETWSRRYERLRRVAELRGVFGAIKGVVRKK